MNLAEFTAVLVAICGCITPALFALSRGARWWVVVLCGLIGILYGLALGFAAGKTGFWLLKARGKHKVSAKLALSALMLLPLTAIGISIVGALSLTSPFVK